MLLTLVAALAITSSSLAADPAAQYMATALAAVQEVKVAELVAHPDAYFGKTVRVLGVVAASGGKDGNWIDVADEVDGPKVRISVDGGGSVVSKATKGNSISVEGVFTTRKKAAAAKTDVERSGEVTSLAVEAPSGAPSRKDSFEIRATAASIKM